MTGPWTIGGNITEVHDASPRCLKVFLRVVAKPRRRRDVCGQHLIPDSFIKTFERVWAPCFERRSVIDQYVKPAQRRDRTVYD
jgi:hypothetical protein